MHDLWCHLPLLVRSLIWGFGAIFGFAAAFTAMIIAGSLFTAGAASAVAWVTWRFPQWNDRLDAAIPAWRPDPLQLGVFILATALTAASIAKAMDYWDAATSSECAVPKGGKVDGR